jgi:general secretion pathway protein F
MPVYEYTALDGKGKTVTGIVDAEGAAAVRQKLRSAGNYPISIAEVEDTVKKTPGTVSLVGLFGRTRPMDIAIMTRQLSTLVGAGFPLVSAIDTLVQQTRVKSLKKMLARIKDAIVEGNSFANALSIFPGTFSPIYINMVHAGETSGTLEIVLERLAEITEKQEALKSRVRTAMVYPILMLLVGCAVLYFLMTFVVPSITGIFADMNQVLPAPTRILIAFSGLLQSYWWLLLILIVLILGTLYTVKRTAKGQYLIHKTMLTLPILGPMVKRLAVSRVARTLGSLLENGVSMLTALDIVKNIAGNVLIAAAIDDAAREVGKGQGLGNSLSNSSEIPHLAIQMIQVGEQSGDLEPMLTKVADVFETEFESSIMRMTALLEPLMILLMATVVGFIVISIVLPIFEMNQLVR